MEPHSNWKSILLHLSGAIVAFLVGFKAELMPSILLLTQGVTAWRFVFLIVMACWIIYALNRGKTWLDRKFEALTLADTKLFNRVSEIYEDTQSRFDKIERRVEAIKDGASRAV
jgi:hypothetical protein